MKRASSAHRLWKIAAVLSAGMLLSGCGRKGPDRFGPAPEIDPALALEFVKAQIQIGPRYAGSEGAEKTVEWIRREAAIHKKIRVSVDAFTMPTPEGEKVFRNVIAEIPGKGGTDDFVLIAAHYDTKKLAFAPDFQGANDGASGVAALLAMIRAIPENPPESLPFALRFIFLDGEESLYSYTASDGLHGSRRDAEKLAEKGVLKHCRGMILLDMIGDRDLCVRFPEDTDPHLLVLALAAAEELGSGSLFASGGEKMIDDHVPYQSRGVPAILFIDFEYGPENAFWHTARDTMERISGESIASVANTAFALIWKLAAED